MPAPAASALLPHAAPMAPDQRLVLYAIRRMAAGGLTDAHAASALLARFGLHFRRPLVLLRAMMAEISRVATRQILVAPCCCPRMSDGERILLGALLTVAAHPTEAHAALADLLHVRSCQAVMACVEAVAGCFVDLGHPLGNECTSCN